MYYPNCLCLDRKRRRFELWSEECFAKKQNRYMWTKKEDQFLIDNPEADVSVLKKGMLFNRTDTSIKQRIRKLRR